MSGMASFLVGLGGGYIKAKDKEYERDRQAKIDERADFDHQQKVDAAKRDTKLRTELSDAGMQRTAMQGTVTEGAGQKLFSADPAQAAQLKNMTESIAELEGTGPVTQTQGAAITGNMSKGHEITTGPLDMKKLQELNSPQAIAERQAQTYNNNGRPLEANQMRTGAIDLKAKQLGLNKAEYDWGITEFNRRIQDKFNSTPDTWEAGAKIFSDTQVGGLAGVDVKHVISPDGKTVNYVGTMPDGTAKTLATFPNSKQGQLDLRRKVMSATPETQISWLIEDLKAEQAAAKLALDERKVATTEKRNDAMAYKLMGGGGGGGSGGGGGGGSGGGAGQPVGFDPYEGFDPKNAQSEATALVDAAIASSQKPVSAAERARLISEKTFALRDAYVGQNTNRQRVAVFKAEARKATTPEAIEAVRARALASGYTPSEMAELDPRFKIQEPVQTTGVDGQTQDRTNSPSAPISAFQQRLQAAKAEEATRRAATQKAEAEQRERQRQELLKQRPDLQQIGGMRYFN